MHGALRTKNHVAGPGVASLTGDRQLPKIQVFSRPGCHLCEVLVDQLLPLISGRLELEVCNIATSEKWQRRYGLRIPVVLFNGRDICQYKLDVAAIRRIVADEIGSNKAS